MKKQIGMFVGSHDRFNVLRDVDNFGWMLSSDFDLDLITTKPHKFISNCNSNMRIISNNQSGLKNEIQLLFYYLNQYDPDILMQVDRAQIHGNITSIFSLLSDMNSVYRYSADLFNQYKYVESWKKIYYFLLNNIIGYPPLLMSDEFVALGPYGHKQLLIRGVPNDKITILPPVIDPNRFQNPSLPDITIPESRSVILFLGRRTHLKGIQSLESSIPKILNKRDDIQFLFVGGGRNLEIPRHLENHTTVIGPVEPANVPNYLRLADVLIHPSFTEGLPRVLLESLATETPVIARDVGDISSVTDNTFELEEQMVELICNFESLPLDPIKPFYRSTLRKKHIDYFHDVI